jgi:transposase
MDRNEAEELYDSGKEATVLKLIEYGMENKQLKETIAQLQKNSQNSSKPPSTDRAKAERQNGKRKKRKPGGQPGHKGSHRELLPVEEINYVIDLYPEECECCASKKLKKKDVKEPYRWQVFEIPPITPEVTEYRCHAGECLCGHETKAKLPHGVATSNFGPRLSAIIVYMVATHHLSRRGAYNFCQTMLGVNICLGSIQALLEETSRSLEPMDNELQAALPDEAL